ncbi:MAG TPA: polysaccharide deacetylase family protein [Candidatus Acidoferrales bacterium]|nr:polysaccharide deacetylase family protein [Candidatus Acidoferrales bacterium]
MSDLLPVELVFCGQPFDAAAVRHTIRHLAMRVGWQLVPQSRYRLLYATSGGDGPPVESCASSDGVVVASSPPVSEHLQLERTPFPVARRSDGRLVPFPHPTPRLRRGWIDADVVAGAYACLNLWYEQRTRPAAGWITYDQDWMARIGLPDPLPLADQWLDMIYDAALELGWPATKSSRRFTVVLTHDVDYLPRRWDRGFPRLARAVYRQLVLRKRPLDALVILGRYLAAVGRTRPPYLDIPHITAQEARFAARSSFQFVVAWGHRADPRYARGDVPCHIVPEEWEVCLHSSYLAARTPGSMARERKRLEALAGRVVRGGRQHYLNFEPAELFREAAAAGLGYDLSVGYNDRSGPRAGTYFPFRPNDLDAKRPYQFWEIPFVLMDTTLATTYRLGATEALAHAQAVLDPVAAAGGCVAIIWHQEQCGGLLDPGYDRTYFQLLEWLAGKGGRLTTGASLIAELDAAWEATIVGSVGHGEEATEPRG